MTFWSSGKAAWLERCAWFQNLWRNNLVHKQLQYTYLPISQEAMKFSQLIEHNTRNIFVETSCTKWGGETIVRLLSKQSKLRISLDNSLKFCATCFYCMSSWGLTQYIETNLRTTCFHLIWSFFVQQKRSETFSLRHLLNRFWRKIFLLLSSMAWPIFTVWFLLLRTIFGKMYNVVVC